MNKPENNEFYSKLLSIDSIDIFLKNILDEFKKNKVI
jgi:hypothetical protein